MLHLKTNEEVCLLQLEQWLGVGSGISKIRMVAMAELIVFAFSDYFSAESSKFSADSGIHGIHFLGCMVWQEMHL